MCGWSLPSGVFAVSTVRESIHMKLLDLFCGAGGAAMGYRIAGFNEIVGVDHIPQPRYPFTFIQGDALEYLAAHGEEYDVIHASPPCQAYVVGLRAVNTVLGRQTAYGDYLAETYARLHSLGIPWIIENVETAPLRQAVRLCGSSFGLPLRRHRLFASSIMLLVPQCDHAWQTVKQYRTNWRQGQQQRQSTVVQAYGNSGDIQEWKMALGIDWMMTHAELSQAIPPAYTRCIGQQALQHLRKA